MSMPLAGVLVVAAERAPPAPALPSAFDPLTPPAAAAVGAGVWVPGRPAASPPTPGVSLGWEGLAVDAGAAGVGPFAGGAPGAGV